MADVRDLIVRYSRKYGVDPRAALAVARHEGGWQTGAVGDQGTSFGPFQLHVGGALPQGRDAAWANSPAGIEYAIRTMANSGARGLMGRAAVEAIVRKFERPRDPDSQVAKSWATYATLGGDLPVSAGKPPNPAVEHAVDAVEKPQGGFQGMDDARMRLAVSLLQRKGPMRGMDPAVLQSALASRYAERRDEVKTSRPSTNPSAPAQTDFSRLKPAKGSLAEAFYDPVGQWDNGRFSPKGIGGHGSHVHLSITNPQAMLAAIKQARAMGLDPRENLYSENVDPVHTKGSFHYQTFPGKFDGRQLSKGVDVSGDPAKMAAYFRWSLKNLR